MARENDIIYERFNEPRRWTERKRGGDGIQGAAVRS